MVSAKAVVAGRCASAGGADRRHPPPVGSSSTASSDRVLNGHNAHTSAHTSPPLEPLTVQPPKMGVMVSDLSRTVADSLRLDVEPWSFEFPRVLWPEDWRLPHLRGFEDWGDRQRRRARDVRRHRIWRSGQGDWADRDEEDQRRTLERKLTRAERDRDRRRSTTDDHIHRRPQHARPTSSEDEDDHHRLGKTVGADPLDDLGRYVRKARVDLADFGWAPPPRKGVKRAWDREIEDEEDETRRRRDEAFEVLQRSRGSLDHRLRLKRVRRVGTSQWDDAITRCEFRPRSRRASLPFFFASRWAN